MPEHPDWFYDDRRQVGLDFEDADQVAAYDARQGTDPAADRATLERLGLQPGAVLIDIGCGTGSLVRVAAEAGYKAFGYDVSPAMLDFARKAAQDVPGAVFRRGGFLSLDWDQAPVDAVTSSYALHHLPDFWKQAALLCIFELLKPGGRLLLRDVAFSFPAEAYTAGVETWIDSVTGKADSSFSRADFVCYVREEHSTYTWILEGLLERAGFRLLESRDSSEAYFDRVYERP